MPIHREIHNLLLHDDEKCYCKDTLQHLKHNEQKYYILKNVNLNYFNDDNNMKDCSFYVVRQRLIEWLIVVQNYYSSSEETLEMSIRMFDYIYFQDLFSGQSVSENENSIKIPIRESNYKVSFMQNDSDDYDSGFSDDNNNRTTNNSKKVETCVCGSFHNGWLQLDEMQLVALACFFLSAKFWERFPPKMSKLITLTEHCYSEQQLLDKEKEVLSKINFDLKIPLVTQYLEFYMLHESVFLLNKVIPVCHYLYNLTLTEVCFLNKLASSLGAAILTLARMVLCSFALCDPDESYYVYDTSLFGLKDFQKILSDLWAVFNKSIFNKDSFRLQKKKFSDQKYSYLPLYIESVDFNKIHKHYEQLDKYVNSILLGFN